MRLSRALKEKTLDVRLLDKHLQEGKVTQKEVDSSLKSLPDDGKNATFTGGHETHPRQ